MKIKYKRHPFKWFKYHGRNIRIDSDIAPLLSKMWKLGIHTTSSCQGQCSFACKHKIKVHPKKKDGTQSYESLFTNECRNHIWLAFESTQDLELLLNIVAEYVEDKYDNDHSMYYLMNCDRFVTHSSKYKFPKDSWTYIFFMGNQGVEGHWGRPMFGNKRSTQEMWIEDDCKENNFLIQPQVAFPRKHLAYVEERLQLALDKKKRK